MQLEPEVSSMPWARKIIEGFAAEMKITGQIIHHGLFNAFENYSKRIFEKNSVFRSIVFKNAQRKLIDYYLPLTLVDEENRSYCIDQYPAELIFEKKHVVIIDTAGMGKSTLLRYMYLDALERKVGIPLFFELRRLQDLDKEGFLDLLIKDLSSFDELIDRNLLLTLLREGEFIFLLDGFDEIPDSQKSKAIETLNEFILHAPKNLFIISSRDEPTIANFATFKKYNIRPLSRDESDKLIRNYAEDQQKATNLIEMLKEPEYSNADEFLTNPLLVSLLYRSFEYKNKIPLRKHLFYEQVFNSLFEEHDLSKDGKPLDREKRSKLGLDRFHKVMRALGYMTYFREQKLQYDVPSLKKIIAECQELSAEKDFQPPDFLIDIEQKVPLLTRDGPDIRWSHKSIQEYFAADFIFKDHPKKNNFWKTFSSANEKSANANFISLYRDIDTKGFRQSVVKTTLEVVLSSYDSHEIWMTANGFSSKEAEIHFEYAYFRRSFVYSADWPVGPIHLTDRHDTEKTGLFAQNIQEIVDKFIRKEEAISGFHLNLVNPTFVTDSDGQLGTIGTVLKSQVNLFIAANGYSGFDEKVVQPLDGKASFAISLHDYDNAEVLTRENFDLLMTAALQQRLSKINLSNIRKLHQNILQEIKMQDGLLPI